MNSLAKKISLSGLLLLLSACAHHPAHTGYYPDNAYYGGGYSVVQRSYYGGSPAYYKGYDSRREFFRHHDHERPHDSHRWNQDYPAPRQQRHIGEYSHDHDAYQAPRQAYSYQKRNDYRGFPESRGHEHKDWQGRQFDRQLQNQEGRAHQENRQMRDYSDERGKPGRGGFNRRFDSQGENQNRRAHLENRSMHNREDEGGGNSDRGRANRWRN